jgi:2-polyprenyl-3-methyl-5-hydroxy-6-metoxy-1,4-benzoquinol methylase
MSFLIKVAHTLSCFPIFNPAKVLLEKNQMDFWLPLNRLQKLYLGSYMILHDYAQGTFPPTFADQAKAYEAEENFFFNLAGVDPAEALDSDMRKPFWFRNDRYIQYFLELCQCLEKCGVHPPQTILELGAGSGWMCEFLATMKFNAIATTIGSSSIEQIELRAQSLNAKSLDAHLRAFQAPMETVDEVLASENALPVDAVFVFEALHHAYDWEATFKAVFNCLKPGGWFLICREPNLLHTFVSYRVAKLSNTHEIGMSRSAMLQTLREVGFQKRVVLKNHFHFFIQPHWIAAQK